MNNSKVLVTGATGLTGSHTVRLLLDHGRPVRVLAHREDERSKRLQVLGAEVTIGDLLNLSDVRSALNGVQSAYFVYPLSPALVHATVIFAQAAKEAGLPSSATRKSQRSPVASSVGKLRISGRTSMPSQNRLAKPAMVFSKSTAEQSQSNCKKECSLERIRLLRRS